MLITHIKKMIVILSVFILANVVMAKNKGITNTTSSPQVMLKSIDIDDCKWTGGFWGEKFESCHNTMLSNLWGLYSDPDKVPAFINLQITAGLKDGQYKGSRWLDGDFFKWLEAVAYVYAVTKDEKLNRQMDEIIKVIGEAQEKDGYITTHMTLAKKKRFHDIRDHETYNMGHLMTAACIHYRATGKTNLLQIAKKAGDCLYNTFMNTDRHFIGYSSIMGLVELYRTTGEKKYLDIAEHFVNMHGTAKKDQITPDITDGRGTDHRQDYVPFRHDSLAVGHAVWANYLYCGATDVYSETGDEKLGAALERIWQDAVTHKMYITGGIGAIHNGFFYTHGRASKVNEAYGNNYVLPNFTAYNETCSNIANAMWNWRMMSATGEAKYADIFEQILYNSVLSSISLDGTHFFYANPLARSKKLHLHKKYGPTRWVQIKETCCPPNIVRTIAKANAWAYSISDKGLVVNFYGSNVLDTELADGSKISLKQETNYPWGGTIKLTVLDSKKKNFSMMLRIPGWTDNATIKINGESFDQAVQPGTYAEIRRNWKSGDVIELELHMTAQLIEANPLVENISNQVAVKRGPVVYCLESVDLPKDVSVWDVVIPESIEFKEEYKPNLLGGATVLEGRALIHKNENWQSGLYRPIKKLPPEYTNIRLIPYSLWSNRGESEMSVWMPVSFGN